MDTHVDLQEELMEALKEYNLKNIQIIKNVFDELLKNYIDVCSKNAKLTVKLCKISNTLSEQ